MSISSYHRGIEIKLTVFALSHVLHIPSQDINYKRHMSWFFMFSCLRWYVVVRFVDIGGIVDHHYLNSLLFCWYWWICWPSLFKRSFVCWYWWNCWPSLFKLSFVLLILVELFTITIQTLFCFVLIGGIVDHHYLSSLLFVDIDGIVDHHYLNSFVLLILVEFLTITI